MSTARVPGMEYKSQEHWVDMRREWAKGYKVEALEEDATSKGS